MMLFVLLNWVFILISVRICLLVFVVLISVCMIGLLFEVWYRVCLIVSMCGLWVVCLRNVCMFVVNDLYG